MILGRYPDDGVRLYAASMPAIRGGDMETIKQPLDFLGMNLYSADAVRRGKDGKPEVVPLPAGYPITGFEWAVTPSIARLVPDLAARALQAADRHHRERRLGPRLGRGRRRRP